jgi:hypothetical protein
MAICKAPASSRRGSKKNGLNAFEALMIALAFPPLCANLRSCPCPFIELLTY